MIQGNNVSLNQSGNTYTISAPAYSISLPGGNVAQITNGISTSTAPISPTNLTLSGANNNILSAGGNTIALNTYSAGTGIAISGSAPNFLISNTAPAVTPTITGTGVATVNNIAPNYTVNVPMSTYNNNTGVFTTGTQTILVTPTLSIAGNVLRSGPPSNTVNIPAPLLSYTPTSSEGTIFLGSQSAVVPNYTLANTSNTITLNNGFASSTAVIPVPVLALTGTTLQSGPLSNTVSLAGLNGIYGGSGAIPVGETTVSVGTNTLTFLSGNTSGKSIANFYGGGFTGTNLTIGHIGSNSAALRIVGSASSTPVLYGNVSGSSSGISITGGSSLNGLYATTSNEAGVGTFTTGTGKFVVTHSATQANPTIHLRENSGALSRIKFSNIGVANRFFEAGASVNAADNFSAYSISFHDGTNYKSRLLIYGNGKTSINNMHSALTTFHVMDDDVTSPGIASEGFGFSGKLNIARNNPLGTSPTYTRGAVFGGDEIGQLNFAGYDGSAYGDGAKIYAKSTENITSSNKGTELIFSAVPTGTNTNKDVFKINGVGNLEVISGLQIPFNAAAGRVLTSDASGTASWQPLTAPAAAWTSTLGNTFLVNSGDKVGIGTNSPSAKLTIANTYTAAEGLFVDNNSNTHGIRVFQAGVGDGIYAHINNPLAGAGFAGITNSNGAFFSGQNSGNGSVADFNISNAANNSSVLNLSTSGQGGAITAQNNSSSTAAIYGYNSGSYDGVGAYSNQGRALYAQSSSTLGYSTAEVINYGSGNGLLVTKASSTSQGNVATFANNSSNNGFDAVQVNNFGPGASIRATSSSTVAGSTNTSVWLENGHLKSTQPTAAIVTTVSVSGGISGVTLNPSNCTDVKGSLNAVCTTTGNVNVGGQVTIRVTFNKTYNVNPTVVITPNTDLGPMSCFISNVNTGSFNVTIKNNTPTNISGATFTYGFNYMVIE